MFINQFILLLKLPSDFYFQNSVQSIMIQICKYFQMDRSFSLLCFLEMLTQEDCINQILALINILRRLLPFRQIFKITFLLIEKASDYASSGIKTIKQLLKKLVIICEYPGKGTASSIYMLRFTEFMQGNISKIRWPFFSFQCSSVNKISLDIIYVML